MNAGSNDAECPLPVDVKTALTSARVTATLTRPHPTQIEVDGDGQIVYGPEAAPGMVVVKCSLRTASTSGADGWEFDVFLIAVKDGQARSHTYVPRYTAKGLLTMPGAFGPGAVLLSPDGGAAIYHLRIDGGDAVLETSSGVHGEQYNVYDAKLSGLTKALGDQFQKAAVAS